MRAGAARPSGPQSPSKLAGGSAPDPQDEGMKPAPFQLSGDRRVGEHQLLGHIEDSCQMFLLVIVESGDITQSSALQVP